MKAKLIHGSWITLGAIALGVLIWVLLPRLPLPIDAGAYLPRIAAIVLTFSSIAAIAAWRLHRRGLHHHRLMAALSSRDPTGDPRQYDPAVYRRLGRIGEALLASCESHQLRGHGGYVQRLRWYLVVGHDNAAAADAGPPPGSSEELLRAAARASRTMHPSSQHPVNGAGLSQGLRWWFIGDALYLEVMPQRAQQAAGHDRESMRDLVARLDGAAQAEVWSRLFSLLAAERGGAAFDGVILALDAARFAIDGGNEPCSTAATAGNDLDPNRLDSTKLDATGLDSAAMAALQLAGDVPLTVVLTRSETIAGAEPLFASLSTADAGAPLGIVRGGRRPDRRSGRQPGRRGSGDWIGDGVDAIVAGLRQRVPSTVAGTADRQAKLSVLGFPRRFAATTAGLQSFLSQLFGQDRNGPKRVTALFFAGSAAIPERHPADTPRELLRRDLFTAGLFNRVFGVSSATPTARHRHTAATSLATRGTGAAVALAAVALLAVWAIDYQRGTQMMARLGDQLKGVQPATGHVTLTRSASPDTLQDMLGPLAATRAELKQALAAAPTVGQDALIHLRAAASAAHRRSVEQYLLPFVTRRLEEQMQSPWTPTGGVEHSLAVYRMLGGRQAFDREQFSAWATAQLTPRGRTLNTALAEHLLQSSAQLSVSASETVIGKALQRLPTRDTPAK